MEGVDSKHVAHPHSEAQCVQTKKDPRGNAYDRRRSE
jgi:hypothetical protein